MKSSLALSLLSASLGAQAAPLATTENVHASNLLSTRQTASESADPVPAPATTWDPPAQLVAPLKAVWDHEISTYSDALGFRNYGYDQVIANNGSINYCVRWESDTRVSAETRSLAEKAIQRQFKKWMDVLKGFDGWPYDEVPVKVVGWAVRDKGVLEGDTSGLQVYTGKDADGIPQCDEACGRFFHQDGDYSGCKAGVDRHYDQSLWITDSMEFGAGAGGDWGQRLSEQEFVAGLEKDNIETVLHELGHTFALDDFYDWVPTGVTNFIMLANSADHITEFDAWMLRDWWRNLKSRYDL